jgi:GDP-L-fucose synthase
MVQLQAYRQEFGFRGVSLLLVNLYGPGDHFDLESSHVIPALVRKFLEARESGAEEVVIWGTGTPTREFLYVEDAARAVELAVERLDEAERFDSARPDGQPRRCLDVTRAREWLGFQATTPLAVGLPRTIAWYQQTRRSRRAG